MISCCKKNGYGSVNGSTKYTRSASIGLLPMIANKIPIVTSVSAIAISGDATATMVERSGRFSSTSCMLRPLLFGGQFRPRAAHQQSELLPRRLGGTERRRQPAVEHYRDAVGNLGQFVEILADYQYRGAAAGKIDQRLTDHRSRAGIDAPGRLTDDKHAGFTQNFTANDEFLQIPAG